MSSASSVTHWIRQLQAGDHDAAQPLWDRYFQQMVQLARQKLKSIRRGMADEEDVAVSAFDSFCRGAEAGRFPQLADSDSLWPLLVVITVRKALDLIQSERRQKRGGGRVQGESALIGQGDELAFADVLGAEPSPEFAAEVAEEYRRLLARLPDEKLRALAQWKLEGFTNDEIAIKLGCVRRSVERKLQLIRSLWQQEGK